LLHGLLLLLLWLLLERGSCRRRGTGSLEMLRSVRWLSCSRGSGGRCRRLSWQDTWLVERQEEWMNSLDRTLGELGGVCVSYLLDCTWVLRLGSGCRRRRSHWSVLVGRGCGWSL